MVPWHFNVNFLMTNTLTNFLLCRFEMLIGLPPFYHPDHELMFQLITESEVSFPSQVSISEEAKDLITKVSHTPCENKLNLYSPLALDQRSSKKNRRNERRWRDFKTPLVRRTQGRRALHEKGTTRSFELSPLMFFRYFLRLSRERWLKHYLVQEMQNSMHRVN